MAKTSNTFDGIIDDPDAPINMQNKGLISNSCKKSTKKPNKCGVLIVYANGKQIKCGDEMFGKKRYCMRCSQNVHNANEEEAHEQ